MKTGIVPFWRDYDRKTVVRTAQLAEDLGYEAPPASPTRWLVSMRCI